MEISTTLNRCVKELSSDTDIHVAIHNLLEVIDHYFDGDRSYIFEINYARNTITNTHEYVKNGVSRQMDNLQELPIEVVSNWMEKFKEDQVYYISSLDQEMGMESYEILKEQDIQSLLAVPLRRKGKIIGFLGVDNPRKHNDDATLLSSIQYFITNSLSIKKQQEQLQYLSYRDMLTQLYNRNKYISVVAAYDDEPIENTGVAFIDLNGLKKINDEQGHDAGDSLIARAGKEISKLFPENAFRVGGDEFVIILSDVEETVFARKLKELQEGMNRREVSISIGSLWKEKTAHLRDMLAEADQRMYEEKERYHKANGDYRR